MPDLITRERALINIQGETSFTAAKLQVLDHEIRAASQAVCKYCNREFTVQNYDEIYNGARSLRLLLKQHPIVSVERVAYAPQPVLTITNTSTSAQQARVKVEKDQLTLTRVASGVTTVNSLAYATYATLSALKTAIDAVANGWAATLESSVYGYWPSIDLAAIQFAAGAMNADARLRIHTLELSEYEVDTAKGILIMGFSNDEEGNSTREWQGGINYWRVVYTAGYQEVPADVQEATAQWAAVLYHQAKRDPGLQYEAIDKGSTINPYGFITPQVIELLRPYRVRRFLNLGG